MILRAFLFVSMVPMSVSAQDIRLPGNAKLELEQITADTSFDLPIGPWSAGTIPTQTIEGTVTRQVWRIDANGLTTLLILRQIREQLRNAGYLNALLCETDDCGGFDFRFGLDVVPPPQMQVDLGDFRYLSATKSNGDGGTTGYGFLISRTKTAGFIQVTRVGPPMDPAPAAQDAPLGNTASQTDDLAISLELIGRAVLSGLVFETGSAQLSEGAFASLEELAAHLSANPDLRVALVGHTDSEGSLSGNIALSKRRAGSVLERLVRDFDIPRSQLAAEGMGYLSPIANNLTEDGRDANRRVEVIIISTAE